MTLPNPSTQTTLLLLLDWCAIITAAVPALLFTINVWLFRRPQIPVKGTRLPPVSVLIPARNEEISIGVAIESVMALQGIEFELVVLDDGSTDRTAEIVSTFAAHDSRIRLEAAPPLPMGWNGKQHACWALASLATYDIFCFLDADVRIGPEALVRMVNELTGTKEDLEISLVSGFPQQETGTLLEKLLLPLIHFVLLGFLPLPGERFSRSAGFAAGCGQFMVVRREAYFATGGHSSIRTTMHDGLILPQLFRTRGSQTRVYNLTAMQFAGCTAAPGKCGAGWPRMRRREWRRQVELDSLRYFCSLGKWHRCRCFYGLSHPEMPRGFGFHRPPSCLGTLSELSAHFAIVKVGSEPHFTLSGSYCCWFCNGTHCSVSWPASPPPGNSAPILRDNKLCNLGAGDPAKSELCLNAFVQLESE